MDGNIIYPSLMWLRAHARLLWLATWLIGLALLIGVIRRAGFSTLLMQIRHVGWTFAVLILLSGGRQILRTAAWSACITPGELRPRFLRLFGIRLVADAATDLTLAGPLLGESFKIWLAAGGLPPASSLSSVVLENLIYGFAVGCFMLGGITIALVKGLGTSNTRILVIAGLMVLLLLMLLVYGVFKQRQRPLTQVLEWSKRRYPQWRWREHHEETLKRFEEIVLGYYRLHRNLFYGILWGEVAANFTGVAEAYLILGVTSGHQSFLAAYLVEALNRMVTVIFAFIPLRLGVDEGSTALMMKALGYPGVDGVSLALIRKLRTLVWVCVGISLMSQYTVPRLSGDSGGQARLPLGPDERG
jgi:hypothetical protein